MNLAILQMADTPQIESSAVMLRHAGYEVKVCSPALRDHLRRIGCDTVLAVKSMTDIGYDLLDPSVKEAETKEIETCDLFVEIKVRNVPKLWKAHPRLEGRTAWWRVNGARPEHVIKPDGRGNMEDCGDEMNSPCPVISANLWYGHEEYGGNKNYVFWPPYPRSKDYDPKLRTLTSYSPPFCLCHGIQGWGFKEILSQVRDFGVKLYGVNAPDGIVHHSTVPALTAKALCMVHVKGVDCPGWALYEAMLGGCPLVVPRWLIHRMLGQELFEENVTCLAFGSVPNEHGRGPMDWDLCLKEIQEHLDTLKDAEENKRIGMAGMERLHKLMWNVERDGQAFNDFMKRSFTR